MPLLLNVMQNANGPEYRKLRVKAMECAGLIGEFILIPSAGSLLNVNMTLSHRRRP